MIYTGPAGNETTFYATPMFEKVYSGGAGIYRSYIYANNRPVVLVTRATYGVINVQSLLVDHQGSISSVVTDSTGASLVSESFTAYGNRREASTWTGAPTSAELTTMNGVTREGYTFQTVLGSMGLNHMNGRVEDSVTGRFLSPDPYVPNPGNTQSFNRYSYVRNNPLTRVDPTGFKDCVPVTTCPGELWHGGGSGDAWGLGGGFGDGDDDVFGASDGDYLDGSVAVYVGATGPSSNGASSGGGSSMPSDPTNGTPDGLDTTGQAQSQTLNPYPALSDPNYFSVSGSGSDASSPDSDAFAGATPQSASQFQQNNFVSLSQGFVATTTTGGAILGSAYAVS